MDAVTLKTTKYAVDNFDETAADYNQSGDINISDATAVQMVVAKLI